MLKASWRALADCINDNDEKVASSKKKTDSSQENQNAK